MKTLLEIVFKDFIWRLLVWFSVFSAIDLSIGFLFAFLVYAIGKVFRDRLYKLFFIIGSLMSMFYVSLGICLLFVRSFYVYFFMLLFFSLSICFKHVAWLVFGVPENKKYILVGVWISTFAVAYLDSIVTFWSFEPNTYSYAAIQLFSFIKIFLVVASITIVIVAFTVYAVVLLLKRKELSRIVAIGFMISITLILGALIQPSIGTVYGEMKRLYAVLVDFSLINLVFGEIIGYCRIRRQVVKLSPAIIFLLLYELLMLLKIETIIEPFVIHIAAYCSYLISNLFIVLAFSVSLFSTDG